MGKEKAIKLTLFQGEITETVRAEDDLLIMYKIPRRELSKKYTRDLYKGEAGIYLLYSNSDIYVGQTKDLEKRLKQHAGKSFWNKAILFYSNTKDPWTTTDLDYLEDYFIKKSEKIGTVKCHNAKKGNQSNAGVFEKTKLSPCIDDAVMLMNIMGMKFFQTSFSLTRELLATGTRRKKEALIVLKNAGIDFGNHPYYASNAKDTNLFAVDVDTEVVKEANWCLICNDTRTRKLILFRVPVGAITAKENNQSGIKVRRDTMKMTVRLDSVSFKDVNTCIDFSKYKQEEVEY